jgi:Cu/Ag efflux protein CusF
MNAMARSWMLLVSLGIAIALVSVTGRSETDPNADTTPPAQSGKSSAASDQGLPQVSGTIKAIDLAAGTITVKSLFLSKTISVRPEAQIGIEGKANASLSDLNVGDSVLVIYHRTGQALVADKVTRSETKDQSGESSPSSSGMNGY